MLKITLITVLYNGITYIYILLTIVYCNASRLLLSLQSRCYVIALNNGIICIGYCEYECSNRTD